MSELFYFVCVYPLESVLGYVLRLLNTYTQSFGFSIILLSLIVNAFLLKLFFMADSSAKKHAILKQRLDGKIQEFKRVFRGGELYAYIRTLYRQNHYHPIYALKALGGLALQVPFFVAIVFLLEFHSEEINGLSFGIIKDLSKPDALLFGINLLPLLMSLATFLNVFISSKERASRIQGSVITLIFLVLLYKMPSALLLYWTTSMVFALLKTILVKKIRVKSEQRNVVPKKLGLFERVFTPFAYLPMKEYVLYRNISIFVIINICLMIFIYNPFSIYASDVTQFNPNETIKTLGTLVGSCLLCSFLLIYFSSFFYKTRLLKLGVYGVSVIFIIGVIYNFVLDYNVVTGESYSQLDNFTFKNPDGISGSLNRYVDLAMGLLSCLVVIVLQRLKEISLRFLKIFMITILIVSGIRSTDIYFKNSEFMTLYQKNEEKLISNLPSYTKELLTLSSNEKNILIVLSDAFSGSHFEIILNQFQGFKEHFSGFVYYPNAISLDGHTNLTAHTILTGHSTSALNNYQKSMSEYNKAVNLRLIELLREFSVKYKVDVFNLPHLTRNDDKNLLEEGIGSYKSSDDFVDFFLSKHTEYYEAIKQFQEGYLPIGELVSIGLFNFSPYVLRTRNYALRDNGYSWLFGKKITIGTFKNAVSNMSELESMVDNLKVYKTKKPIFKYIHTSATHYPYAFDSDCKLSTNIKTVVPKEYFDMIGEGGHYESEICAVKSFIEMIEFLKKSNIYDNTMLIFVSDHSYNDVPASLYSYGNNPNPLILIKNFNATGPIKIDKRLVSNADIASIICDIGLGGCHGVEKNILDNYPKNRILYNTLNVHWTEKSKVVDHLIFEKIFEVHGDSYDPKNWKDITGETLKNLSKKERDAK